MTQLSENPLIALQPDGVEIPGGLKDLRRFLGWVHSAAFPERGRVDWIAGRLEVDLSPEDLNTHGSPKSAIVGRLWSRVQESGRGMVFIDRTRYSCRAADLSVEPDVLVLLVSTLQAGGARLVPKASGEPGRFVEVEGRADLVVECVSDSSEAKDTERLRRRYHDAGVPEYWLVDARKEPIDFQVLIRDEAHSADYRVAALDERGFARSPLLGCGVRLERQRHAAELVFFQLELDER